ncbi:hypothetical protein SKAU_G00233290 [Synaphobranchus kaupii]|uniref:Uncharacterized protein n=1 Tax=Synaphobranchus kaupii TaxID=118154 RepID=A0A9Q1F670_SYNKA|nr:hypothetical protein SKAU_G00233290 [Synaphobranchus kaupii]
MDGVSPLHDACLGGHATCAKFLLENGANVTAVTINGVTPLFNTCCSGSAACLHLLLEYGPAHHPAHLLASPLHQAVKRGADVHSGKAEESPLHAAAQRPSVRLVELLLEYGANVQSKSSEGRKPVELAVPRSPVERALQLREGNNVL